MLLPAEAPPSALDRYFYFPTVWTQDSLFRYVVRSVLKREPECTNKAQDLARLQASGVFLVDVAQMPAFENLSGHVAGLVRRVKRLDPRAIFLIKAGVFDAAFGELVAAGLPVINERVPFPGSGNQAKFEVAIGSALRKAHRIPGR